MNHQHLDFIQLNKLNLTRTKFIKTSSVQLWINNGIFDGRKQIATIHFLKQIYNRQNIPRQWQRLFAGDYALNKHFFAKKFIFSDIL